MANKEKSKGGRPKIQINKQQFESLCAIQCTEEEICSVLGCCEDTLDKWCHETYNERFSVVFKQKRTGGHASLRRNQWRLSETNPTMAIFLGKQYLGQKDKPEEQAAGEAIQEMLKNLLTMNSIVNAPVANRDIEALEEE